MITSNVNIFHICDHMCSLIIPRKVDRKYQPYFSDEETEPQRGSVTDQRK